MNEQFDKHLITPVLLCGGSGSRLFPLSKPEKPKQFLPLLSHQSMLQETALRVQGFKSPIILSQQKHIEMAISHLGEVNIIPEYAIAEPYKRNTGPAFALAAHAMRHLPEALLLFLPCDHQVKDLEVFHNAILKGTKYAQEGYIVLFGARPASPETAYGYIQAEKSEKYDEAQDVSLFHEKPDKKFAEKYIEQGFLWNTGIVLVRVSSLLQAFKKYAPNIWEGLQKLKQPNRLEKKAFWIVEPGVMEAWPTASFDVTILEKNTACKVIPVSMGWHDIGQHVMVEKSL